MTGLNKWFNKLLKCGALIASFLVFLSMSTAECRAESDVKSINACGIVNRSLSVDPTGLSEGFSAVLYDNTNGLPTSEANAIAETSEGFLWIGSYAGLIRYDGNTFDRLDSTGGITSIKSLYVDSKDRLWIGTNDNGVAVMERENLRIWGKMDGMSSAHIRAITEGPDGIIYVATTVGIMMIDQDFNLKLLDDPVIAEMDMRDIRTGNDGAIYGVSDAGDLMVIRDGKLEFFMSIADNPLGGTATILPDPENPGVIYLEAADMGLYKIDLNNGFKVLQKIDIDPLKYLRQMEYIDGKIWICSTNGIGVLDNGKFTLLDNLPMNNNVCRVMTDYLGNLWFTSTRQGVMKVVPNQFSDLFERFDIPDSVVNSTSLIDGKLFVATDTGLIVLDENGPISSLPLTKAVTASGKDLETDDLIEFLTESRIRSVIRDSKDRLWISTWRASGLLRYDHGELTAFTEEEGLLSPNIRAVSEASDGSILVAITGGVNIIKDDRVIASYGKEDGIENTESLTVAEGTDGDIVLGSNGGGIYVFDGSGLKKTINVEEGLSSDIVMRIKRDTKRDILWLVTSNSIAYLTPDYQVTTIHKFPYPNNFDLYESARGDMWVLCSNGIYVTPAEELIANGEINPVYYSVASGLPVITTANSYSELTDDGDLYIAGSTGVCKVNIDKPFEDVNDLKAVVPYLQADGQEIYPDESGTYTIPSTTHKLTVQGFVYNFSLSDPQVTYQLEGFDRESTTISRSDMLPVDYTNLRGGTYYYKMTLRDSLGRGNKEVSVKIVKEKAFYEQAWFYVVLGLAAVALLVLVVRIYIVWRMQAFERKQQQAREQFEQTAEALASAIDAKDTYTNGHSRRVAEYSERIAKAAGKSKEECEQIYFAALLHDVGKIGVSIDILTKKGRLTDEEYEAIKQHPAAGGQILSKIKQSPWLSLGAHYHHERYDGRGYPEGLKGTDIPEIARIIAVADSYDAMTSNRSYRNAIPQHIVREELVKGIGTQFDPDFARVMIHMIDLDTEYKMKESVSGAYMTAKSSLRCDSIYHECSDGIGITRKKAVIHLISHPDVKASEKDSLPSIIIFDSLDGNAHPGGEDDRNTLYLEYAQIRFDGRITEKNVRKAEVRMSDQKGDLESIKTGAPEPGQRYRVEAVRNRDHIYIRVSGEKHIFEVILALPDTARYAYLSISGERCEIHNIKVDIDSENTDWDALPRIAEEISYISGCPTGDIPNIQVDGPEQAISEGIPVRDGLTLTFHTMSYPTARLVWHCPYISLYSAAGGNYEAADRNEYQLLRLDGESYAFNENALNAMSVQQAPDFKGWEAWKDANKNGLDCKVKITKENNKVIISTENYGIIINSTTTIKDGAENLYVALTGDQCALTDIHISRD